MPSILITREQQIVDLCLRSLCSLEGLQAKFTAKKTPGKRSNGQLLLNGPWGEVCYTVEIKIGITLKTADLVVNQIRNLSPANGRPVLLTDYVHIGLADALKHKQVEFIDTVGNIYLNHPPLYVEIKGRKKPIKPQRVKRAFQMAGLKLIFFLLSHPEAVHWNYRKLAREAGIALGTVGWVLTDLREMDYLRLVSQGRQKLANVHDLLNRWEIGYTELLRPRLLLQTCRFVGAKSIEALIPLVQKNSNLGEILIGGELGAAMLTNQLRPEQATLFIKGEVLRKTNLMNLLPYEKGNVELVQMFGNMRGWRRVENGGLALADPVLIHAELSRKDSERLQEITQQIFDEHIAPRLDRD